MSTRRQRRQGRTTNSDMGSAACGVVLSTVGAFNTPTRSERINDYDPARGRRPDNRESAREAAPNMVDWRDRSENRSGPMTTAKQPVTVDEIKGLLDAAYE